MAKLDEISSTDKLLRLIRNNQQSEESKTISKRTQGRKTFPFRFKKPLAFKKAVTVGIDLGYDDLKLAKIAHGSSQKHQLIDYIRIPYDPGLDPSNPEFPKFLKKHLNRFCRGTKSPELWSTISSARVELRYLRIPKVPPKQIPNAVYWSHRKVAPYNEGESIFDYLLLGERVEDGVPKLGVVSFTVPRQEIQHHRELFAKSGYSLTGISIIPFAIQNLFRARWIRDNVKTVSSLYIGRDWSRIDVYSRGHLVLSRGIKAGIKTMLEAMRGELNENETDNRITLPSELMEEGESPPEPVEPHPHRKFDTDKAQQIFFGLIHDSNAATETHSDLQPEEEEIYQLILPALSRLVQQVERTFEHYSAHFGNEQVRKIYISSGIRPHRRIVDYIGDELGLPREIFDPFKTHPDNLDDIDPPEAEIERGAFTPAIGMGLSNNEATPNFLFTYKEKAKAARSRMLNKAAMVAFFLVLGGCLGFYGWQNHLIAKKEQHYERLQNQLNSYKTRVDENLILNLVQQTRNQNEQLREYSRRFLSVVALTEISNRTPSNVRLTNISVLLSNEPAPKTKGKKPAAPQKILTLDGIVLGNRAKMETVLAGYLLELSESPLFSAPKIGSKEVGFFYDKEVLRFTAQLKLL